VATAHGKGDLPGWRYCSADRGRDSILTLLGLLRLVREDGGVETGCFGLLVVVPHPLL
jgi:hypothetical protein